VRTVPVPVPVASLILPMIHDRSTMLAAIDVATVVFAGIRLRLSASNLNPSEEHHRRQRIGEIDPSEMAVG